MLLKTPSLSARRAGVRPRFYGVNWDSPQTQGLIGFFVPYCNEIREVVNDLNPVFYHNTRKPLRAGSLGLAVNDLAGASGGTAMRFTMPFTMAKPISIVQWCETLGNTYRPELGLNVGTTSSLMFTHDGGATNRPGLTLYANSYRSPDDMPHFTPHHMVGTNVGFVKYLYVNGVQKAYDAVDSQYGGGTTVDFGDSTEPQYGPAIKIFEARIYKRVLTAQEAWELYDPATRWDLYWQPTNTAYAFGSQTPTAGLVGVEDGKSLVTIRTSKTKATGTRPPFQGINRDSWQAKGLVVWCPGGPSEVLSQTALTASDSTRTSDPLFGSVISAEAANARVSTTCADAWKLQGPVTLTAWVKFTGTPSAYSTFFGIAANLTDTSPYHCLMLGTDNANTYRVSWNISGTFNSVTTTATVTTGDWTLLVARCPLDTLPPGEDLISVWLNGREQALAEGKELPQGITYSASAALVLGDATTNNRNPQVRIADARIYNRALSNAEIYALYDPATRWDLYWTPPKRTYLDLKPSTNSTIAVHTSKSKRVGPRPPFYGINRDSPQAKALQSFLPLQGNFRDAVTGRVTGALDTAGSFGHTRSGGQGLYCNGTNEAATGISIPAVPDGQGGQSYVIWVERQSTGSDYECVARDDGSGFTLYSFSNLWWGIGGSAPATPNVPTCIVVARKSTYGTDSYAYVNGVRVSEYLNYKVPGTNTYMGGDQWAQYLKGYIWDFRTYNKMLSPEEIWNLYDPATRWDLYWTPSKRTYVDLGQPSTNKVGIVRTQQQTTSGRRPPFTATNEDSDLARGLWLFVPADHPRTFVAARPHGVTPHIKPQTDTTIVLGTPTVWMPCELGGMAFDLSVGSAQTNGCIRVRNNNSPSKLIPAGAFAFWLKLRTATPTDPAKTSLPVQWANVATQAYPWTNGTVYTGSLRAPSGDRPSFTPLSSVDRTQWHHIACSTGPNGGWKFWQNGRLAHSVAHAGDFGTGLVDADAFGHWENNLTDGWMTDLRAWTRELTDEEVARMAHPATRWELYWTPKRTYVDLGRTPDTLGIAPSIWTSRTRRRRPMTTFYGINWDSPQATGLLWLFHGLPNGPDIEPLSKKLWNKNDNTTRRSLGDGVHYGRVPTSSGTTYRHYAPAYRTVEVNNPPAPMSLTAWAAFDTTATWTARMILDAADSGGYWCQQFGKAQDGGSSALNFYVRDGRSFRAAEGTILLGWHHYAVTATDSTLGADMRIYRDGISRSSETTYNHTAGAYGTANGTVYIGGAYTTLPVYDIRCYTRTLSQEEVAEICSSEGTDLYWTPGRRLYHDMGAVSSEWWLTSRVWRPTWHGVLGGMDPHY